jgi:hypothetical protein
MRSFHKIIEPTGQVTGASGGVLFTLKDNDTEVVISSMQANTYGRNERGYSISLKMYFNDECLRISADIYETSPDNYQTAKQLVESSFSNGDVEPFRKFMMGLFLDEIWFIMNTVFICGIEHGMKDFQKELRTMLGIKDA